ncbi:MAG: 1-acyl-sn-glycerol-3-phosphate acyltransferase, partial [Treponema sp.]|nr:1-acyl-sn-glycerol-3-phosphate acyltransferase [Treponema sp.]
ADGFPIQEYTVHILPAIYPKEGLSSKENTEYMRNKNYEMWKEVYEKTYGIPLTYTTEQN